MTSTKQKIVSFPVLFLLTAFFVLLSGCSTWHKLNKKERGAVIGGTAGAVVGNYSHGSGGAVVGGVTGAVAGGLVGRELDRDDERR